MIQNGLHGCSRADSYVPPKEPEVQAKLKWFTGRKLGIMFHFGIYSQLGIVESWALSDEDASWSRADVDWEKDGKAFREQYWSMNKSFNPVRFVPEDWAEFASRCGFRYAVFTTKHHDGFCMFDTKYTDYKVTAPDCPFHTNKNADIVRAVFNAFRAKGIGIAAYYSKPDWHSEYYWPAGYEKPVGDDRNPTYDLAKHSELWEKFEEFTHNQMLELVRDYGPIDILWLDGGQVRPDNDQNIHLDKLAKKAREINPGLLFADRTVGGELENYITPEQSVPDEYIPVPWESCVTVGTGFSFRFEDDYKSSRTLVNMLASVVCRGGNLALNIGPQPDGRLPIGAMRSCEGLGEWLRVNGGAIYDTEAVVPYESGNIAFTKLGGTVNAIIRLEEGEVLPDATFIPWEGKKSSVRLLGAAGPISAEISDGGILVKWGALAGSSPVAPTVSFSV